ncbi:efflux RND transporter periplasmic adaptor subunit [Nostoc sp.]|uniref:efflux RND transporter periplasmic adaptor subunit n=1 Tax=Nostoc sp. TaxID=1180 RepID=UPI002FF8B441
MKHLPKRIIYIISGLGIITLTLLALRPDPIRVEIKQVKRASLLVTVDAEAKTRIRSRFVISNTVAGRLARIQLKEGDTVKRGAVVGHIDPLPLDTQLKTAQANLQELQAQRSGIVIQRPKQEALSQAQAKIEAAKAAQNQTQAMVQQAKAALEQAERDRLRAQKLVDDGAISRQNLESAQLLQTTRLRELQAQQRQVESAAAEVVAAKKSFELLRAQQRDPDYLFNVYDARIASVKAELANLADNAARSDIRSPSDGSVLRVLQESARYVEAGTPLLELGNPSKLELVADILSSDAVKVKPGTKILIERWGGDKTLEATVRKIEPSAFTKVSALGVEEQRVNIIGDFVDSSVPLGDNYRVETRIVVWQGENVLTVPLSALFRCQQSWCTFVVEKGRAKTRVVEIDHRNNFEAAIKSGLKEGEMVILHPTEEIKEGSQIADPE